MKSIQLPVRPLQFISRYMNVAHRTVENISVTRECGCQPPQDEAKALKPLNLPTYLSLYFWPYLTYINASYICCNLIHFYSILSTKCIASIFLNLQQSSQLAELTSTLQCRKGSWIDTRTRPREGLKRGGGQWPWQRSLHLE